VDKGDLPTREHTLDYLYLNIYQYGLNSSYF